MAKLTKLQRSNNAHRRLYKKYSVLGGRDAQIKEEYHASACLLQEVKKRLLSKAEKRRIYKQATHKINGTW